MGFVWRWAGRGVGMLSSVALEVFSVASEEDWLVSFVSAVVGMSSVVSLEVVGIGDSGSVSDGVCVWDSVGI